MSSPNDYGLELSLQAEADIEGILQYTYQTYGKQQEEEYFALLTNALLTIQNNPFIGLARPDLSDVHRTFKVGHHVIIYLVQEQTVFVARILHERMDFLRHLD